MRHHEFSPSSLPMLAECPCFSSSEKETDYTSEGTKRHRRLQSLLEVGVRITEEEEIDDATGVVWAYNKIKEKISQLLCTDASSTDTKQLIDEKKLFVETIVFTHDGAYNNLNFGTCDLFFWDGKSFEAILFDLKTGQKRDATAQMANYALAWFQRFPEISVINSVILYSEFRECKIISFSKEMCENIVFPIIAAAKSQTKKKRTNQYCDWCEFGNHCQARLDAVDVVRFDRPDIFKDGPSFRSSEIVKRALTALDLFSLLPDDDQGFAEAKKEVQECSEAIGYLLHTAKSAAKYLSGIEFNAKKAIKKGITIDGFKLKNKTSPLEVTDIQSVFELSKLSSLDFLACCDVSVSKIAEKMSEETIYAILKEYALPISDDWIKKSGDGILKSAKQKALEKIIEFKRFGIRGENILSIVESVK